MKDRSRSAYDTGLVTLIIAIVTFATVTVYSQSQSSSSAPATPAAPAQSPAASRIATPTPTPTPTPVNWSADPMLKRFVFRSIGPASMGGRIDDIAAVESNPYIIYVGFATGGVWKSTNNGTTFQPIFDTYSTASIGDIAIAPSDPNIVWVGTGEANNRQSSSFGDGIYKSTDAGKTFTKMGLENSQTIARIVIDPKNPNVVYVAVLGHLFGSNKERGIYKTTDGGKTWNNINFIDEDTGFTDLVMDNSDNKTLYAASYQRRRTSWGFNGGGPGSGIWKTVDAGKTWKKLEGSGLPAGVLGRIGLDTCRSNPNVIYAQMEVGASTGTGGEEQVPGGGQPSPSPTPSASPSPSAAPAESPAASPTPTPPDPKKAGVWRSDDKGKTWRVVSNENNRPMYYSQIRVDPKNPENVFVGGLNFSKSTDGGKTFKSLQPGIAHSDHHAIWIDPNNGDHILIGNDGGLDVSYDQGATWEFINTIPAAQFYAIAVDMRKPYYVYGGLQDNGSWGGPSQVRSGAGITNADWYRVGGGDGFYNQVDPSDPNIIYSESQNGAMNRLDLRTGRNVSIRPRGVPQRRGGGRQGGANPTASPSPGASPETTPDAGAALAAFAAAQGFGGFGNGNLASNVVPTPAPTQQYRFYWNTPLVISPHNPRILYAGGDRLFKSLDRGDTWMASPDLTKHIDRNTLPIMGVPGKDPMPSKNDGYTSFGYIVTIAESPKLPGVLWVGTDDGNVQLSRDGGVTWTNVVKNVPGIAETYHIARVEPSHFDAGTCYLAVDGHRLDDLKPYLFVTRDYGATWKPIVNNLPAIGNVNVIREDPKNKELLYVGTEFGLFVSLNGGGEWKPFMSGLPRVRVDDIVVHPRDNDLVVGTHGRGIYILDDIGPLQQFATSKVLDAEAFLFDVRPGTIWMNDPRLGRSQGGAKLFRGSNPQPGTAVSYYLKSAPTGDVKITIVDYTGKVVRNIVGTKEQGINRIQWNLRGDPLPRPAGGGFGGGGGGGGGGQGGGGGGGFGGFANLGLPLEPGTYTVKLSMDGKDYTTKAVIENDPGM
ncbi:MAG: WD40/YVTN/BNR-like repeat-containing protein [Pyrinomonadaceae bacterium]